MRAFLEPIPTWLVLRGDTGLIGAAHYRLGDVDRPARAAETRRSGASRSSSMRAPGVAEACLALQDRDGGGRQPDPARPLARAVAAIG